MGISFTGLSSGIDTASLIEQLVAAERSSATKLQSRQSDLTTQRSIVNSLSGLLATFSTAAKGLASLAGVSPRTASSSDANVSVAASATAAASTHTIRVAQLARAQVVTSRTFASKAAGVLGAGSLDLTSGGTTKTVTWGATDSLDAIATKINDAKMGTTASVLNDGTTYRLVLTAQKTGTASAVTFADGGDGLDLADPANVKVAPRNALLEIDGVDIERASNVIDDAITGLTITARSEHAVGATGSEVAVKLDATALKDKVKAFVTAYNGINASLNVQLGYTGSTKGTNTLFGDATLRRLQTVLASTLTKEYGGGTLGALGIQRDRAGVMTLDEAKLMAAVESNSGAVEALFVTGGLASAVTGLTEEYTRSNDGILAAKTKSITDRHKSLQSQIDQINKRADSMQKTFEAQFNALEAAMSRLQTQSSYLAKIL